MRSGFFECVAADIWRCRGENNIPSWLKAWFSDPAFRPVFTLRVCQAVNGWPMTFRFVALPLVCWWHLHTRLWVCVDIPWRLSVGPGFKLLHGLGVVINDQVKIGQNVTIMQGVTIGGASSGIPIIEDDVIVCANATVIGGVTLGRGCVVGAGAVVIRDVPAGYNAVGNPARNIPRKSLSKGYNSLPPNLQRGDF